MIRDIHIFSTGTQTSAQGVTREFKREDLKQVVDTYRPDNHEAPILIGHEMSDKVPSWGWVRGVKMKGDDLVAEVEFSPLMEDYVKNGLYKKVSASFYSPESKINPEPGNWSLRHVAMLGAQPPAVKGLKGFAYSEESEQEGVLDFAVEMKLSPETVFDEELGPTLKSDVAPLGMLKEKLDEARSEMAKAEDQNVTPVAEEELEQEQAADQQGQEFAEEKKAPKGKMGKEDSEEEIDDDEQEGDDEDFAGCGSKRKKNYKEGDDAQHQEPTFEASKKKRGSDDQDSSDVGVKEAPKSKIFEASEESEDFAADCLTDGKPRACDAPPAKGMSGMPAEEGEGEGPVASKVKKNKKSGECEGSCEDGEAKYEEEEDEAIHGELTPPSKGADGMKGRPASNAKAQNDQAGRGEVGKAGVEGETGRKKTAKGKPADRSKTGKSKADPDGRKKTAKAPAEDRAKVGKSAKGDTNPMDPPGNSGDPKGGSGRAAKGKGVHVEFINHSEQFAELTERLAQLEAANAQLVQEKRQAEIAAHRAQLEEFAESLYASGKLTPAVIEADELVDYMEGLEYGTLEFAEGEHAASKLQDILASLPQQVSYSEVAAGAVDEIDFDSMDPHEKAMHLSQEEGLEYAEALKQVLFSAE